MNRVSINVIGSPCRRFVKTDPFNPLVKGYCDRLSRTGQHRSGCIRMKFFVQRITTLIVVSAILTGCQSGPRWAWWKHDTAPDSSAVARSAEPQLPSAQSTPQAVAAAGLTPAAPPSSANLAAAGASPSPQNISIPVTSSATVANAPAASYSPANMLADKLTAAPNATAGSANITTPANINSGSPLAAQSQQPFAAAVPPGGPYDPKAYKPAASRASGRRGLSRRIRPGG